MIHIHNQKNSLSLQILNYWTRPIWIYFVISEFLSLQWFMLFITLMLCWFMMVVVKWILNIRTIPLVKIFVIIFIRIGTFFKNTKKYSESLYLLSEFFIQVNYKIFWNFESHNFLKIFFNFLDFITFYQKLYKKILEILRYFIINIYEKF